MPIIHATYQCRGYIHKSGHMRLGQVLAQCATLYNAALQERRDAWKMAKIGISFIDQCKSLTQIRRDLPEWGELDTQVARGVLRRVDKAFNSFFRRVKRGQTPGYPRFKPRQRYTCIEVAEPRPGMVKVSADGSKAYVRVMGLPVIQLRLRRGIPDSKNLKALRIVLRPNGLMVDMAYEVEKEPLSHSPRSVGLDLGVTNRIALSDGTMVAPREVTRGKERRLRRAVSRCRRGSGTRRKRIRALSRETRRNTVRNRNGVHEVTTDLVRQYGSIAVEKLVIPGLTRSARGTVERPGIGVGAKSGLNRRILDQTWGIIRIQLRYKAEWAGRELAEVDPRYTSRICHECGHITPQSEYRTYRCGVCGRESDRDHNAAVNILQRAFGPTRAGIPLGAVKPATVGLAQDNTPFASG